MNAPGYGLLAEMEFIDGLGSHSVATSDLSRRELLLLYLATLARRTRWGSLDRHVIETHVRTALGRLVGS